MTKDTPSMAKNKMRRCFAAILDPHPPKTSEEEIWKYFESECSYCGVKIDRDSRTGHLDHVRPGSDGGTNSIYNRVLSCSRCNGDEKREESWESFLERKAQTTSEFAKRKEKIEQWISNESAKEFDQEENEQISKIVNTAIESFDLAVEQLRQIRRMSSKGRGIY